MAGKKYLLPIKDYQFNLKSEKINSIARLVKLGIPTVPLPHLLLPDCFLFYWQNKQLPVSINQESESLFAQLKKAGYTVTVRPSLFSDLPGVEFLLKNSLNLPVLTQVVAAIKAGYDKIIQQFERPEKIEFAYLLQGFYTANKAGLVFSNDGAGHVYLEAAFGETTNIFTRGGVTPDIYQVDRQTGRINFKKIANKKYTLEPSASGLKQVSLSARQRIKPVFTDQEIEKICQYALKMEKVYGPQEIECATLRSGEIIFQSSRNSRIRKQKKTAVAKNMPIFARSVRAPIVFLTQIQEKMDLSGKIVITDNLEIDFITNLVYCHRPKAVILTRGSLTAHAVTILREAKIPSALAMGLKIGQAKIAEVKTNGEVTLHE